jgi:hypothetical protein
MKKISTLNELNFLDIHGLMHTGKGHSIDEGLVEVGRVYHEAQLGAGRIADLGDVDAVAHLQVAGCLWTDLPVLQHVELVGQFFLLLVGVGGAFLALPALVVQRSTTSLHSESTLE